MREIRIDIGAVARASLATVSLFLLFLLFGFGQSAASAASGDWALTAFGGRMTDGGWPSMLYNPGDVNIADASLFGLGLKD